MKIPVIEENTHCDYARVSGSNRFSALLQGIRAPLGNGLPRTCNH
jgi:hypothetical protein